jgi:5-methylcytosine-specific restriction endonuclease McrA
MTRPAYRSRAYATAAKKLYGQPCHYCGKKADTADHVPALCTFPSPELWDGVLVPACRSCNSSKGNQDRRRYRNATRPPTRW